MRAGKTLRLGFNNVEVCDVNGEEYVRLEDVPRIAQYLYAERLVEFAKAAVQGVALRYNPEANTIEVVEVEKDEKI